MGFIEEQQLESAYVMGTYARKPVELVRGRGMQVEDSEGRTYLDFVSGVGAVKMCIRDRRARCPPTTTPSSSPPARRSATPVSYTHLDVYKRQAEQRLAATLATMRGLPLDKKGARGSLLLPHESFVLHALSLIHILAATVTLYHRMPDGRYSAASNTVSVPFKVPERSLLPVTSGNAVLTEAHIDPNDPDTIWAEPEPLPMPLDTGRPINAVADFTWNADPGEDVQTLWQYSTDGGGSWANVDLSDADHAGIVTRENAGGWQSRAYLALDAPRTYAPVSYTHLVPGPAFATTSPDGELGSVVVTPPSATAVAGDSKLVDDFLATVSGVGEGQALAYQWQVQLSGGWANLPGQTGERTHLSVANLEAGVHTLRLSLIHILAAPAAGTWTVESSKSAYAIGETLHFTSTYAANAGTCTKAERQWYSWGEGDSSWRPEGQAVTLEGEDIDRKTWKDTFERPVDAGDYGRQWKAVATLGTPDETVSVSTNIVTIAVVPQTPDAVCGVPTPTSIPVSWTALDDVDGLSLIHI